MVIVLILAAMTPEPLWLGLVLIAGFTVEGAVQTMLLGFAKVPAEPVMTIVIALAAAWLHVQRVRRLRADRQVATVEAEMKAVERLAATLLAIRDLAHTPLQILEMDLEILRR